MDGKKGFNLRKGLVVVRTEEKTNIEKLRNLPEYDNFYRNHFVRNYGNNLTNNYDTQFVKNIPAIRAIESETQDSGPKKTPKSSPHGILQEYTESSSVHGVQYLGNHPIRKTVFEMFLWICVMIAGFVCLSLLVKQLWQRYVTNPTSTYVSTFHAPVFVSPYPAVTICPFTPTPSNTTHRILQNINIPPDMTTEDVTFFITYGSLVSNPTNPETIKHEKKFSKLLKHNDLSLAEFLNLTRSCDDMIDFVLWNGDILDMATYFHMSYSMQGLCCSFNYRLEEYMRQKKGSSKPILFRTAQFGVESGLFIAFKKELFPDEESANIERVTESIGIAIIVHHSMEYPGDNYPVYVLQEGQELQLSVAPFYNLKPLNFYRPDNTKECTAEDEGELTYFPDYRYPNCFADCRIKAALRLCGCVLANYFQPVIETHSLPACTPEDFPCWRIHGRDVRIVKDVKMPNFTCICRHKCRSATYRARPTLAPISDAYLLSTMAYRNVSKHQAVLRVFLSAQVYRQMETTPTCTELSLLSSLGGIFSLFLGCSFLSAVEVMYFLSYVIVSIANSD